MRKLLIYMKDYKKESVLAPLFKLLEASFELLVPLVMARIIDRGIGNGDRHYVTAMCLLMVSLGIIGLVCSATAQYFAAKAAVGFSTKLRHVLFSHIQGLSFTEMDTMGTSTLITRMTSDINQVQNGVNMVLRLFLRSPCIVFGAMIMAFTIDVKAALIFVVTIPLLSVVVFGIMLITIPLYKKTQAALDRVLGITRENLTGVRVIRAFNKEEEEKERFQKSNDTLTAMQKHVGKISGLMNPMTYVLINGALVVLLWTGAIRVDTGYITQGQLIALVNYMSQILVELIKLANLIITITKALACANRVESVLEIQSSMQDGGRKSPAETKESCAAVEFCHVGLTYKTAGDESLTDINFKAGKGQTIGIIGGTGSGKSSLVHLIPRFYDVTAGEVRVNGVDVRNYPIHELRQKVGMVLQKASLFKGTIRENLLWGNRGASDEELWRALEISQAKEFVEKKEDGLDTEVVQGGKNLSGGQKQRLTIARALVKNPEILILDDSASALDFATDARLRRAIGNLKDKMTVFIVSQRASSVMYSDLILVMEDGHLAGAGSHGELLKTCTVYREIYESQFERREEEA
nr:ABC transporter ATP-binding protein [uncultured Blautia sp.]